jgi:type IV secretion system protein VirD4
MSATRDRWASRPGEGSGSGWGSGWGDDLYINLALTALGAVVGVGVVAYLATWVAACLSSWTWTTPDAAAAGGFVGRLLSTRDLAAAWTGASGIAVPPIWLVVAVALPLTATGVAAVVAARRLPLMGRMRPATEARWATARDEKPITVPDDPARRPHRLVAGRSRTTRKCLAGEDCVSAVVFGPNGSGKTMGLVVPNTLEWQGSVVMTTAKPQDLAPVLAARARLGPVWLVAPGGAPGVVTASWSPVDYATDADSADRMAGWLVDSSGMTGDPRSRPWNAQARKYLKGLLLAARLSGRGIEGFVDWAYEGELASADVCHILSQHGHVEALREYRSTWRIHEEGKGSVLFTAFGLADTYNRPGVLDSSRHSDFTAADLFGDRPTTLLLVTPQSETERFTPYFTALISSIVHQAEQQAAAAGGPVQPRLLLALDEAGNVFRYPRLPHLLTTARGNGMQLLLAYHDIAQIEHLFGGRDVARTILSNAKLRMLLPGVGDVDTLRYFSDLLGQTKVTVGSRQTGPDGRRSRGESDQREPLAPVHLLQQLPAGEAVLLYENLPPARVRLRRWFDDRALRRLAAIELPDPTAERAS